MADVLLIQQQRAPTSGTADVVLLGAEQRLVDIWLTQASGSDVMLITSPTQFGVGVINNVQYVGLVPPVASSVASALVPSPAVALIAPTAGVSTYYDGLRNSAEGQPDGTTPSVANSGGGSGDAFTGVAGLAGNATFSTDLAHTGTTSYKSVLPTSSSNVYLSYIGLTPALGQDIWTRMYFYFPAYLSQGVRMMTYHDSGGTYGGGLRITTAGNIIIANAANTTLDTSPTPIPLNQWIRAEVRYRSGGSVGEIEAQVWWTNPDSRGTPDWSTLQTGQAMGSNALERVRWGCTSPVTQTVASTLYIDDVAYSTVGWTGPYTLNSAVGSSPTAAVSVNIAAPVATATASALVATVATTSVTNINAPVATASASALLPAVSVAVVTPVAGAAASALLPALNVAIAAPVAGATASAPVPTVSAGANPNVSISAPVATATASALIPGVGITASAPVSVATASASLPTVKTSVGLTAPVATATATALIPGLDVAVLPGVATATASGLLPTIPLSVNLQAPVATAAASALVPAVKTSISLSAPVATATASALIPRVASISWPPVSGGQRQAFILYGPRTAKVVNQNQKARAVDDGSKEVLVV